MLKLRKLLIMKILLIMSILLAGVVSAAPDIQVFLNSYDSESQLARIQIQNNADTYYNNVYMQINELQKEKVVDLLDKKASIIKFKALPPGQYNVKIITDEGTIETTLNLVKTEQQIIEEKKQAATQKTASQAVEDKEYQEMLEAQRIWKEKLKKEEEERQRAIEEQRAKAKQAEEAEKEKEAAEIPQVVEEEREEELDTTFKMLIYIGIAILFLYIIINFITKRKKK